MKGKIRGKAKIPATNKCAASKPNTHPVGRNKKSEEDVK